MRRSAAFAYNLGRGDLPIEHDRVHKNYPELEEVLKRARVDLQHPNLLLKDEYQRVNNEIVRKPHGFLYGEYVDPYAKLKDAVEQNERNQADPSGALLTLTGLSQLESAAAAANSARLNEMPRLSALEQLDIKEQVDNIIKGYNTKKLSAKEISNDLKLKQREIDLMNPGPAKEKEQSVVNELLELVSSGQYGARATELRNERFANIDSLLDI